MRQNRGAIPFGWRVMTMGLAITASALHADVTLPAIFSDHMVLQQGRECALWGKADVGEKVSATIGGETRSVVADREGQWTMRLPALSPSESLTLTVAGRNTLRITDVLVGEVWLGSGQSNMALTVAQAQDFPAEKAAANFPQLRMFTEGSSAAKTEQFAGKGRWVICTPESVGRFSAALYFFGRELHRARTVPVGLIDSSVGGTPIESWIPPAAQYASEALKGFFEEAKLTAAKFDAVTAQKKYDQEIAVWNEAVRKKVQPVPKKPVNMVEVQARWMDVGGLFNGKIAPLIPYTIRGAIWYQGEANAGADKARFYQYQLPLLITEWRRRWADDFPFAWAQLPNLALNGRDWPLIREAQLKTLALPHTGMTVNIDIGDPKEIHAKNKQDIGRRLAQWALAEVYAQRHLVWSGPLFADAKKQGTQIVVAFTHTEGGLMAKGGELRGFTIAGPDRHWQPAVARIEGDHVVVSSPTISDPVAVRYAWENNPTWSLTNVSGLPASPFRTDDWPSQP